MTGQMEPASQTDPIQQRLDHFHRHKAAAERAMTALGDHILALYNAGHNAHLRYKIAPDDHTQGELTLVADYVNEDQAAAVLEARSRKEQQTYEKIVLQEVDLPPLPPKGPVDETTEGA